MNYPNRNPIQSRLKYERCTIIELWNNPKISIIHTDKTPQLVKGGEKTVFRENVQSI